MRVFGRRTAKAIETRSWRYAHFLVEVAAMIVVQRFCCEESTERRARRVK